MKPSKVVRKGDKGQTSVEYLVILAIAIIVAVVAVGVVSGFIKIGASTTYQRRGIIYWKSTDIAVADWDIYQTSAAQNSTLILQNNKEYQVRIDWVSTDWVAGSGTTTGIDVTLLPGEVYTFQVNSGAFNCTSNQPYAYDVTFQYDNIEHGLNNKQFTGTEQISGSCAN
ncbi:hypothetical protein ACFLRF_01240 [Candidatus Altiarchaeota archaeon]